MEKGETVPPRTDEHSLQCPRCPLHWRVHLGGYLEDLGTMRIIDTECVPVLGRSSKRRERGPDAMLLAPVDSRVQATAGVPERSRTETDTGSSPHRRQPGSRG